MHPCNATCQSRCCLFKELLAVTSLLCQSLQVASGSCFAARPYMLWRRGRQHVRHQFLTVQLVG